MSGIDEVIAALQKGAFLQADEILTGLGAGKRIGRGAGHSVSLAGDKCS